MRAFFLKGWAITVALQPNGNFIFLTHVWDHCPGFAKSSVHIYVGDIYDSVWFHTTDIITPAYIQAQKPQIWSPGFNYSSCFLEDLWE
jgi:hypothetical protein